MFLAGTETRLASPEEAATYAADNPGALVAVESRQQQRFLEVLAARPEVVVTPVDRVQGFNYSRGREVDITLYRSGQP